jgi:hypothetical protein
MMAITLPWLFSIRLLHMMTLPTPLLSSLSFVQYIKKFVWIILPISPNTLTPRPLSSILLQDTLPNLAITACKIFAHNWVYDFLLTSLKEIGERGGETVARDYPRFMIYTFLFGFSILSSDYILCNVLPALTSLLTLDHYHALNFNDYAALSHSPRIFWGKRYNHVVSTLLKDSVFSPLLSSGVSPATSAFAAFFVSGLLHTHIVHVVFGRGTLPTLSFFLLHGAACAVDAKLRIDKQNKFIGWSFNTCFLFLTLPLYLGLFVHASPSYLLLNPPLVSLPPHLRLPIPSFRF